MDTTEKICYAITVWVELYRATNKKSTTGSDEKDTTNCSDMRNE